ncbi:MAG: hypothetical protein LC799_13500 [Actinobacteria bacterium]|nr:hypothetical protein [Actinomycetota bacterium]
MGPDLDLVWSVALTGFPDDERVVRALAEQLRLKEHSWPMLRLADDGRLARAYGEGTTHRDFVAQAIEDHLERFGGEYRERTLFELAAIDHGPRMRQALLRDLSSASFPHWAAGALSEHFRDDAEVTATLRHALDGDAVRASMVANAAPRVFNAKEAVDRLLALLRELSPGGWKGRARSRAHSCVQ